MKKIKKNEMLETVRTLENANITIAENKNEAIRMNAVDALTQCQETAILLGNYLDTLGGTADPLVHILEDYCENIYQLSTALSRKIQKQLSQLYSRIESDLPEDKKEIVFLPYKASMWDSLESVWKAADEDQDYDVYVVPIPYYDKNTDGTFGQMHYEGNEYPDYVPITSWEEYKFYERRPDITYIHNPYDQCNHVTSIQPIYYARELKKYTDKLVYIPYFVAVNNEVAPHFCVMPGTLYADRVIVQSDEVRRQYIKELHQFEVENNCKNAFGNIEQKVLALGSPKFDKVVNTRIQDLNIPENWLNSICKQDGVWKKVVLYNTSIDNILNLNETMIEKIEDVLRTFQKFRDEIVLLWRPHPLLPATIKSMRPILWEKYMRIVSRYQAEGWGIYDESSDMNRAIAISDGYYGDGGSVYELYRKTKKPIMLQKTGIVEG
jgi:hypothetical protein